MKNRVGGYIVIGILLVALPLSFFIFFKSKTPMPPPAPKSYGTAPYFILQDQNGNSLSSDDLKGFIYIADFMFTSCNSVCPELSKMMSKAQENYKTEPRIRLLSFTIDPENDSVPVLKTYADKYAAIPDKWFFLTSDNPSYIRDTVTVKGFKVPAVPDNAEPGQFTHTDRFVVVDGNGTIRGFYDVMSPGQSDSMYNHIERLLVEKLEKK